MEDITKVGDAIAIVTYNKPGCKDGEEHQWDTGIIDFWNDERVMSEEQYFALPDEEKKKLNMKSGQVACSKCGMGYMTYDNPYYL